MRSDLPRNSGTPYRQLLDGNFLEPANFYEIAYQPQAASPVYFDFLRKSGVNLISLDEFQSSNNKSQNSVADKLSVLDSQFPTFWGFDVDAVRAADAPGTSAPSPVGLTAEEFCALATAAGKLSKTKIIEFTEVNPNLDIDNRTVKLAAVAMHRFISAAK